LSRLWHADGIYWFILSSFFSAPRQKKWIKKLWGNSLVVL
jgi:hypothetical protein